MLRRIIILITFCLLLVACSQTNQDYVTKTIKSALNEEINSDNVIHISYTEQDVVIYQDEQKIYFYIFKNQKNISSGFIRKEEIFDWDRSNKTFNWYSFESLEGINGVWGIVLNKSIGLILLNGEPLNPNFIDLGALNGNVDESLNKHDIESVSLYYKTIDGPLILPIIVEMGN